MSNAATEAPEIASFRALREYLREDYATNTRSGTKWTFWTPGFQALAIYRIGVWCNGIRPRFLRVPVRLVHYFLSFFVRNFYGIELYPTATIGRRFGIAHQHGIVIHQKAVIGDDCVIRQGVTIGAVTSGGGTAARPPTLGDRVVVGAGAIIAGPIKVGDDVTIGPLAVVMTNVPAGSIVASPQSRIMTPPPRKKPLEADATAETPAPPRRAASRN